MKSADPIRGRWWGPGAFIVLVTSLAVAQRAAASLPIGDANPPNFDAHHLAFLTMFVSTTLAALAMVASVSVVQSISREKRSARATVAVAIGLTAVALLILLSGFVVAVEQLPAIPALTRTFLPDGVRGFAAFGVQLYRGALSVAA